jgi:hypothetical protein
VDRLIDAAVSWLARRRRPPDVLWRLVRIYGPTGRVLREVEVKDDGGARETMHAQRRWRRAAQGADAASCVCGHRGTESRTPAVRHPAVPGPTSRIDRLYVSYRPGESQHASPTGELASEPVPSLDELIGFLSAQVPDVQLLARDDETYTAQAQAAMHELAAELLRMPVEQIQPALSEFGRPHWELSDAVRDAALELDLRLRRNELEQADSEDSRVRILERAAADYGALPRRVSEHRNSVIYRGPGRMDTHPHRDTFPFPATENTGSQPDATWRRSWPAHSTPTRTGHDLTVTSVSSTTAGHRFRTPTVTEPSKPQPPECPGTW